MTKLGVALRDREAVPVELEGAGRSIAAALPCLSGPLRVLIPSGTRLLAEDGRYCVGQLAPPHLFGHLAVPLRYWREDK